MPPSKSAAHSKLFVQLPGGGASKDSANGQNGAEGWNDGNKIRGGTSENGFRGQSISVDFPTFANVLSLGFAAPETFDEMSPTSNEESTTVTAESSSLDAEGLGARREMQGSGNKAIVGRVSSAPYDDRNGEQDLLDVQKQHTATISVKLNERPPAQRRPSANSDIAEEAEEVSRSSITVSNVVPLAISKATDRRGSSDSSHQFRTCSVVETDL